MDHIEKSNLSRQFPFKNNDIGQLKSQTAADAVKEMNPEIIIEAQSNRLDADSLTFYNNDFYESLSGVCMHLIMLKLEGFLISNVFSIRSHC
jgi:ubiquitin-activating enzyme E1